jgi:hypothetical protein
MDVYGAPGPALCQERWCSFARANEEAYQGFGTRLLRPFNGNDMELCPMPMFLVLTQRLTLKGQSYPRGTVFQVAADDPGQGPHFLARRVEVCGERPSTFTAEEADCFPVPLNTAVACQAWKQAVTAAGRLGGV